MKANEITQQQPLQIIVPLIAIVLVIVASVMWTIPRVRGWLNVQAQIDSEQAKLQDELIPKRNTLQTMSLTALDPVEALTEEAVPAVTHPSYLLALIEEIAKLAEVKIVSPLYVPRTEDATKLTFVTASIEGTPADAALFLDYLAVSIPSLRVTRWAGSFEASGSDADTFAGFRADIEIASPLSPVPDEIIIGTQPIVPVLSVYGQTIDELRSLRPYLDPIAIFDNPNLDRGKDNPFR